MLRSEFWSELVEHVCGISRACQENQRPSSTAPIEHFQVDVSLYGDKLHCVRRRVNCILRIYCRRKKGYSANQEPRRRSECPFTHNPPSESSWRALRARHQRVSRLPTVPPSVQ